MPKTNSGALVRQARERRSITRAQLAQRAGVSVNTMVRLENHNRLPNIRSLIHIADELELSIDELAGRS